MFFVIPASVAVDRFLATFTEFPPRQKPMGTQIENTLKKLLDAAAGY